MGRRSYSYELERGYYARRWPEKPPLYEHLEPYLSSWLEPRKTFGGKRTLDIGAGECAYTSLIARRFGPQTIVGFDLFPQRLHPAARSNRLANLKFIAGDCFRLPFRTGSFDVVFGSLILSQLSELEKIVCEIRRVLSEGGSYVGIEPSPYNPLHLYRYFRGNHSPNQFLLTRKGLVTFERAGFSVQVRYFYARLPRLRGRILGTCMGILARRGQQEIATLTRRQGR